MSKVQHPKNATTDTASVITIDEALLHGWSLPQPDEQGDKNERGSVLVVGGAISLPGAIVLAGIAALRAGAGRLKLATCRSIAPHVGLTVLEALVLGLPETPAGGIAAEAADEIATTANQTNATLIGSGMVDADAVLELMKRVLPQLQQPVVVLDAAALKSAMPNRDALRAREGKVILTPHPGEMATMLALDKDDVMRDPLKIARQAATALQAVIVLKGSETYIAAPDNTAYCYQGGSVGLATSGSGDTLAGIIAGLAARGASPAQAAAWGVYLHGSAGNRLTERIGRVGFLARECLDEIPRLLAAFDDVPSS